MAPVMREHLLGYIYIALSLHQIILLTLKYTCNGRTSLMNGHFLNVLSLEVPLYYGYNMFLYNMFLFTQLDVYHPAMFRIYCRKNDMDEPPPLEDGSSYGRNAEKYEDDPHNLEESYYRYGVRPEWLQILRIMNHRYYIMQRLISFFHL